MSLKYLRTLINNPKSHEQTNRAASHVEGNLTIILLKANDCVFYVVHRSNWIEVNLFASQYGLEFDFNSL